MILFLAAACDKGATDQADSAPAETGPYRTLTEDGQTNGEGRYKMDLEIREGETAFQVTASTTQQNLTALFSAKDPRGRTVVDVSELLTSNNGVTLAVVPQRTTTAFNWPIQESDGPLIPGVWKLEWRVTSEFRVPEPRARIDLVSTVKSDPDPNEGQIHVRIVWARNVDNDRKVVRAVESAVEHWRDIWANEGITLVERYDSSDLDPNLRFYREGSPEAEDLAAGKEEGELQLIVGETIDEDLYLFGVSAGIPGTIQASESSYVVLSWLTHAGRDGQFDSDENKLMGETMAHETGHYAGLFHPVEYGYGSYDSLRDTEECSNFYDCADVLGRNLMFPFPICLPDCINQTVITPDQASVYQTFVGSL